MRKYCYYSKVKPLIDGVSIKKINLLGENTYINYKFK